MNYNMNVVDKGAIRFVFVTRGRSKPFDDIEVEEFFANTDNSRYRVSEESEPKKTWGIRDDRQAKVQFLNDLKRGINFCLGKYPATREEILAEANRISPYQRPGG